MSSGSVVDTDDLARGRWDASSYGQMVGRRAQQSPTRLAYIEVADPGEEPRSVTWAQYDAAADSLARQLVGLGLSLGDRVAVLLPDGADLHLVYVANERAGLVSVGIPTRAGTRELAHLVGATGARLLITPERLRDRTAADLAGVVRDAGVDLPLAAAIRGRDRLIVTGAGGEPLVADVPLEASTEDSPAPPTDLWFLNSTSGTTGLPKIVRQTRQRWHYLLQTAIRAADLTTDDVLMSLVPGPFGFGLWSAHVAPAVLGATCVLQERFDADRALQAVQDHRVSVLCCVSTQFQLMLASPVLDHVDLSSLRVLFTGGEAVPATRAREWERRTGSTVLQFYGSNEIGPFSCTALTDSEELRLTTVGRVVEGLDYRVVDETGTDAQPGEPGQLAGRSPGSDGAGYWADDGSNAALFTSDGYLLMPDLATVDAEGYVRIVGRTSDIIIRGGKNISAAAVEADVACHPAVEMAAAVAAPDPVFGERVCVVVSLRRGAGTLDLPALVRFLAEQGVSPENFPEHLVVLPELPQSMGGKVAKSELRSRLPELLDLADVRSANIPKDDHG